MEQRVLSAHYSSLHDDARTDFKAGNTQVKSALFLDELVEICQLACIFFLNIFSNAGSVLVMNIFGHRTQMTLGEFIEGARGYSKE